MNYHKENLYTVDIFNDRVRMLYYAGAPNHPPTATLSAEVHAGMEPRTVTLSVEAVTDPDDVVFDYHWDFGDGSATVVTRTATISHTYTLSGTYTPTLTVSDIRGAQSAPLQQPVTTRRLLFLPTVERPSISPAP
jgi:PKD repeat protein